MTITLTMTQLGLLLIGSSCVGGLIMWLVVAPIEGDLL